MSTTNIIIIALIIAYVVWRFLPIKGVRNITTEQLKKELGDTNKQYIDVRTLKEYSRGYIHGFQNIPLDQLPNALNSLTKDKEIVVICQSGMRSKNACKILKKQGFRKITNVAGGISAWR